MLFGIALGGAIGAMMRYWVSIFLNPPSTSTIPTGTLVANISGSLLLGLLAALTAGKDGSFNSWYGFFAIGVLGAFTTFSTFSLETLRLVQNGHILTAFAYVAVSIFGGLFATFAGWWIVFYARS